MVMDFWLGIHQPEWVERSAVPFFVSRTRLTKRVHLPRALGPWALDSGGFSEIERNGRWTVSPVVYANDVRRYAGEIGGMMWAAPQDWMCEPRMTARTGLTVKQHQRLTVDNLVELRTLDADLPFIPVLQGWTTDDYLRCIDLYDQTGIDLGDEPIVGVGSVCRRQDSGSGERIFDALAPYDLALHGFGVKITGLRMFSDRLASADSMAWSFRARKKILDGGQSCDPTRRKSCANCLHFALEWRDEKVLPLLNAVPTPRQPTLW